MFYYSPYTKKQITDSWDGNYEYYMKKLSTCITSVLLVTASFSLNFEPFAIKPTNLVCTA